ncbi:MAG: hypothetical protein N2712_03295 [Brevinematales bacterium]|nr:hypothetical protein [Brevinematales bacterium]
MRKFTIILLLVFSINLVFAVDFWQFRTSVGSIYNTDLERKMFEEYIKTKRIGDIETWLILASGTYDPNRILYYKSLIDKMSSEISNSVKDKRVSRYDLAKLIFDYLHQNVFKSYLERSTDLDQLFDTGYYNCVNSTAIYNILLKRFGFDPKVVQLPDHIFSVIYLDNYKIEIETTARKGFDVVRNPEAIKELRERTSYVYIPEGKGFRVEIGDEGLIASMYANQVLNYKDTGNYTEILKASIKALILETNLFLAYTNLRSSYIGIFTDYVKKKDYENAILFAEESLQIFKNDREIKELLSSFYYNLVLTQIETKDFPKAIKTAYYIKTNKTEYYSSVAELTDYLVINWAKAEIQKGNYDKVFNIFSISSNIDRKRTYNAGVNALIEISKILANMKEYDKVIQYHKEFLKMFPEGKEAEQNLGYYYNLWGVDLMNISKLEEAVIVFEDGMKSLPKDNILRQNASIAYARLAQIHFDKKDFENSLKSIERSIELNNSKQLDNIRRNIYIGWARHIAFSEENFRKAKEITSKGLEYYPNDPELKRIYDYVSKK